LAQLAGDETLTQAGEIVGTLRYMSPEQANGQIEGIDPRTDIYSLGASLYEALALQPIFEKAPYQEILRRISDEEPRKLRSIDRRVPADLETIICKAMEKDRRLRYASAREFADDLKRFLSQRPIIARKRSVLDRAAKFSRRHHASVVTASVAFMLLSACLAFSTLVVNRARLEMRGALDKTTDILYAADMKTAFQQWQTGWHDEVQLTLDRHRPRSDSTRSLEWQLLHLATLPPTSIPLNDHRGAVNEVATFPDHRRLASVASDGTLCVWDGKNGERTLTVDLTADPLHSVAVSQDGRYLAAGSTNLYLYDFQAKKVIADFPLGTNTIESLAFNAESTRLAAGSRYEAVRLIEVPSGKLLKSIPCTARLESLQFVNDGLLAPNRHPWKDFPRRGLIQFLNGNLTDTIREFDCSSADRPGELSVGLASPDGAFLLAAELYRSQAYLFDFASGKLLDHTAPARADLICGDVSPDGTAVAFGYGNGVIEYISIQRDAEGHATFAPPSRVFRAGRRALKCLKFLDGHTLATSAEDRQILVWDLSLKHFRRSNLEARGLKSIALSPDGTRTALGVDSHLSLVDTATGREIASIPIKTNLSPPAWSPSGDCLAVCLADKSEPVVLLDRKGQKIWAMPPGNEINGLAISSRGDEIAAIGDSLRLLRLADGHQRMEQMLPAVGSCVCFSHDNRLLAYGGKWGSINIADGSNLRTLRQLTCEDPVVSAAFSPDDATLATGHIGGVIRLWDVARGVLTAELSEHGRAPLDLVFSTDGKTLVSAGEDGTSRVWSVDQRQCFGSLYEHLSLNVPALDLPRCRVSMASCGTRIAVAASRLNENIELLRWSIPARDQCRDDR
jgi:WD40 repeat protein